MVRRYGARTFLIIAIAAMCVFSFIAFAILTPALLVFSGGLVALFVLCWALKHSGWIGRRESDGARIQS